MILVSVTRVFYQLYKHTVCKKSNTRARFYSRNLFSAGSVVNQDPTERLHLMSGRYSPVKAKNVVPHDIGDPGRRKTISLTMSLRGCTCLIELFRQSKGFS